MQFSWLILALLFGNLAHASSVEVVKRGNQTNARCENTAHQGNWSYLVPALTLHIEEQNLETQFSLRMLECQPKADGSLAWQERTVFQSGDRIAYGKILRREVKGAKVMLVRADTSLKLAEKDLTDLALQEVTLPSALDNLFTRTEKEALHKGISVEIWLKVIPRMLIDFTYDGKAISGDWRNWSAHNVRVKFTKSVNGITAELL